MIGHNLDTQCRHHNEKVVVESGLQGKNYHGDDIQWDIVACTGQYKKVNQTKDGVEVTIHECGHRFIKPVGKIVDNKLIKWKTGTEKA